MDRVAPQMKATFPLWSTVFPACYLLAYSNPAFINVRLPLTTTKTTPLPSSVPLGAYMDKHREPPEQPFLFLFFLPFPDRFIYHIFVSFFLCGTISCTLWRAFLFSVHCWHFQLAARGRS